MTALGEALEDAGGLAAPPGRTAQLRAALAAALAHGQAELARRRSGYEEPVEVALAAEAHSLRAALPAPPALRADPAASPERGWLLVAATAGALAEAAELPPPARAEDLVLLAGAHGEHLALEVPASDPDPEWAALLLDERLGAIDRLRARARAVPAGVLDLHDMRPPAAADHPLRVAEAVARLGGFPADPASVQEHEETLLELLSGGGGAASPHRDPDPARRVARRIVQRLAGMGKWGGYHTAFEHLARGFAGNDRELAARMGERLLAAGVLLEKPSVGQRHVYLNPRRAGEIHAFVATGEPPAGLTL